MLLERDKRDEGYLEKNFFGCGKHDPSFQRSDRVDSALIKAHQSRHGGNKQKKILPYHAMHTMLHKVLVCQ